MSTAAMLCGWNTSPTTSTPNPLFNRSMLGRDVAGFLSALDRVTIRILLIRRPIVRALFLVFRLFFPLGRFRHKTPHIQDAAPRTELPTLRIEPELVLRQVKHRPPDQPIHRHYHERHDDGGQQQNRKLT